jgi:hypothetical protein
MWQGLELPRRHLRCGVLEDQHRLLALHLQHIPLPTTDLIRELGRVSPAVKIRTSPAAQFGVDTWRWPLAG